MNLVNRLISTFAIGACAVLSWGQTNPGLDTSGNGMLKGTYYFRQLAALNFDGSGNVTEMAALYGTIVFDGKGNYVITGQQIDNTVSGGQPQPLSVTATYGIGANGLGSLDNPVAPTDSTNWVWGGVGQGGVFVGSDTEGGEYNDTFIAIPAPAANATNATFNGNYWVGVIDFPGASETALNSSLFQLTPNGQGALGPLALTGQANNQTAASITQTVTGATYAFTNGVATLTVPTPSGVTASNSLFTGTKTLYLSADGNFVLGGTPTDFDIFFGVRAVSAAASNATYKGLYLMSALEDFPTSAGGGGADSFYGSVNSNGVGTQIMHWRWWAPGVYGVPYAIDFGSDNDATVTTNGTGSDSYFGFDYAFGAGGAAGVAVGTDGEFSLIAMVQAPTFTGSGVFLNPSGIFNAASYAPMTASLSPGELLTLFGTNLSPVTLTTQGGQAFAKSLGGVQVFMNGLQVPIYYVSPTQISVIVPYELDPFATVNPQPYFQIQVDNNGTKSNAVTWLLNDNSPGLFTAGQNGTGIAAALRYDSAGNVSIISASNPAQQGETISLYLTGLGGVTPTISDGAIGPTSPLSQATALVNGYLQINFDDSSGNSTQGNITFAGLAPGLAGLYQMNVQVPAAVAPGNVYLEVLTDSADNFQVIIPVVAP
jgi:uncharacterized protein (TIGR03437 family)